MAIPIKCAGCQAAFDVPDNLTGKTIRCTSCKTQLTVPAPAMAAAAPAAKPVAKPAKKIVVDDEDDNVKSKPKDSKSKSAARRRDDDDDDDEDEDEDERPRRGKAKKAAKGGGGGMIALIAAGAVGLVAIAGVSIWLLMGSSKDDKKSASNSSGSTPSTTSPGGGPPPGMTPLVGGGPPGAGGVGTPGVPSGWKEVKGQGFTCQMPGDPQIVNQGGMKMHVLDLKNSAFMASVVDLGAEGEQVTSNAALRGNLFDKMSSGAVQGANQSGNGVSIRASGNRDVTQDGLPAREVTLSGSGRVNAGGTLLMVAGRTTVYMFLWIGEGGGSDAQTFIASVKIAEGTGGLAQGGPSVGGPPPMGGGPGVGVTPLMPPGAGGPPPGPGTFPGGPPPGPGGVGGPPPMPGYGGPPPGPGGVGGPPPMPGFGGPPPGPGGVGGPPPMPGFGGPPPGPGGVGGPPPGPGGVGGPPPGPGGVGGPPPGPGGIGGPPPGAGGFPGMGGGLSGQSPAPLGAATRPDIAGRIEPFHAFAFDTDRNEFYTVAMRQDTKSARKFGELRRYTYPEFKKSPTTFNLPALATRAVIDSKSGLLFLATATNQAQMRELEYTQFDRSSAVGDVQVFDLKAIQEGKVAEGADLKPLGTLTIGGSIRGLELTNDGKFLLVAVNRSVPGAQPKGFIRKYEAAERKFVKEIPLPTQVAEVHKNGDGSKLVAIEFDPTLRQPKTKIIMVDPVTLEIGEKLTAPGVATDAAVSPDGKGIAVAVAGLPTQGGNNGGFGGPGVGGPGIGGPPPGGIGGPPGPPPGIGGPPPGGIGGPPPGIGGPPPGGIGGPGAGGQPGGGMTGRPLMNFVGSLHFIDGGDSKEFPASVWRASNNNYVRFTPDGKHMLVSSIAGNVSNRLQFAGLDVYVPDTKDATGFKKVASIRDAIRVTSPIPVGGWFDITPDGGHAVFRNGVVLPLANITKNSPNAPPETGGGNNQAGTQPGFPGGTPMPGGILPPGGMPIPGGGAPPMPGGILPPGGMPIPGGGAPPRPGGVVPPGGMPMPGGPPPMPPK